MGFLNVNERKLKRRIHKAEKAHAAYVKEVDKLKETFFEIYDKKSVETLIEVIEENGHPGEVSRISDFSEKYKGENIDEIDIDMFKKLFNNYNNQFLAKRNKKGD